MNVLLPSDIDELNPISRINHLEDIKSIHLELNVFVF